MPLNIIYRGTEIAVEDGVTALIGSDAAATIRIVRPGISRKHAVVSYDGATWKIEDAGSRNGTFSDGERVHTTVIDGPTTLYLGHPTDGEAISFVPLPHEGSENESSGPAPRQETIQDEIDAFVLAEKQGASNQRIVATETGAPVAPANAQANPVLPAQVAPASDAELAALSAALRDQISSIKGLTWSVWAMIAVTAVLAVVTMFIGILGG